LLLPKYDWLFIYSVACVKRNVAERKRHEVLAVLAEMQTSNALYVVDMDKNSSVRMAKTRPPNRRVHRDYLVVQLTITEQKFSSQRRNSR